MTYHAKRSRRFQFSLKAMLILVTLTSIGLSCFVYQRNRVLQREAAIAAIKELGGRVKANQSRPIPSSWLRPLLGDGSRVETVDFIIHKGNLTDAGMGHFARLTELRGLNLDQTQVTNVGLVHISELTELRWLDLDHVQVTDAGMVHIGGLKKLTRLSLRETELTDTGLVYLTNMKADFPVYNHANSNGVFFLRSLH